jgi:hypothetical protein
MAALEQRITSLQWTDWRSERLLLLLGARVQYRFSLNQLFEKNLRASLTSLQAQRHSSASPLAQRRLQQNIDVANRRLQLGPPWATVDDPNNLLGFPPTSDPWLIDFWMGAWDNDALCGFMQGALYILPSHTASTPS